jgi:HEAT repeat protein
MTSRFLVVVLVGPLLLGCSTPDTRPRRASRDGAGLDSMTQLPARHWDSLLTSRSPDQQREALRHLGFYDTAAVRSIPAITRHLNGADESLGSLAAWALAHIGAPAYPTLALALTSNHAAVRRRGAYGLGEAGPAVVGSALEKLDSLSKSDPVRDVRDMAVWALEQITPRQSRGDPNLGMLGGLDSDSMEVRLEAVRRLGAIPAWNRAAMSELIRLLADSSDVVHRATIDALVQKGKAALPLLNAALGHQRDRVRSGATVAITRIHGQL